jgi:hypothetical protein
MNASHCQLLTCASYEPVFLSSHINAVVLLAIRMRLIVLCDFACLGQIYMGGRTVWSVRYVLSLVMGNNDKYMLLL